MRATVRSTADEAKVGHLARLAAALPGTLQIVEADLLAAGGDDPEASANTAFDGAFAGCAFVFHTASPFFIEAADPQVGPERW